MSEVGRTPRGGTRPVGSRALGDPHHGPDGTRSRTGRDQNFLMAALVIAGLASATVAPGATQRGAEIVR